MKNDLKPEYLCAIDPWYWAYQNKIILQSGNFTLEGHEYQVEPMQSDAKKMTIQKAAQMGFTEMAVLKSLHGLIHNKYPLGVLYLFPTGDDVADFSRSRYTPLIDRNYNSIGQFIKNTDSTHIKQIGKAFLYLRGAKLSSKAGGKTAGGVSTHKKDSSKLRSIPVDRIVFDERDLIEDAAISLALERMSHSKVREILNLSTPTIPEWGISKEYNESDQRVWMIKCRHCGERTCLELEFPNCIQETPDGVGKRVCKKCKKEIYPCDGTWVAQYPSRSAYHIGYWISQLNSVFIAPGEILKSFKDPPPGGLGEIYNSKLGMPYIDAEFRLTEADVWSKCSPDPMVYTSDLPAAMGVDVGKEELHVVIGVKTTTRTIKPIWIGRVKDFKELHDVASRFQIECAVIDAMPETRKVREFQEQEHYQVWLCEYIDSIKNFAQWDEKLMKVQVNRNEICDATHDLFKMDGAIVLPRKNDEMNIFAKHMTNIAKVYEEDDRMRKRYYYRKLGADHYRHALNYFYLATTFLTIANQRARRSIPIYRRVLSFWER